MEDPLFVIMFSLMGFYGEGNRMQKCRREHPGFDARFTAKHGQIPPVELLLSRLTQT
jgi:hypothetical protein